MTLCNICAWRETCQKKFMMSGKDMTCTDFVKDVSIKDAEEEAESGCDSETNN